MKVLKKVARFIISFILTISIITFVLIHLISSTILNEAYILESFNRADYYNKTYELVKSNFQNYIDQSGMDEEILENIITKEKVEQDTKKIIINIYDGLNEKISTQEIKEKLKQNIMNSMNNRELSQQEKNAIDTFIEKICDEYKITISNYEYEKEINNGYQKIMNFVTKGKNVLSITIVISIILLIILDLKKVYKTASNIGISATASGAILTIVNIYINSKIKVQTLTILNDNMSVIVRNITGDMLNTILNNGIILLVVGLILIILSNLIHNVKKYKILKRNISQEN